MTALDRWQRQVMTCRQERDEADGVAWQRAAQWYDQWVAQNDYVAQTLPKLRPLIDAGSRVLEVGPGSGGFTLPLSEMAREIVALEPSEGMREVLARHLVEAGRDNVRVIATCVEECLDEIAGPFDLALASYSLYNVLPIDRVIRALVERAVQVIALMGTGEQETWYRELYHHFKGRLPVSPPQVQFFYPLLQEMGLDARVDLVPTSANYVYPDEAGLIDQWMWRLRIDPSRRAELRDMLLPLAERRNGHIGIYRQRQTALVRIRRN